MKTRFILVITILFFSKFGLGQSYTVAYPTFEWWTYNSFSVLDFKIGNAGIYGIGNALIKMDTNGNQLWANTQYRGQKIVIDNNGNLIIKMQLNADSITFGSNTLVNHGNDDVVLVKLDSNGALIWAKIFGGTGSDLVYEICCDYNNDIYLSGTLSGKMGIHKISSSGTLLWQKIIKDKYDENRKIIYSKADSTIVICGLFKDTFYLNNQFLTSFFSQVYGSQLDVYFAKIKIDSNLVFMVDPSYHDLHKSMNNFYVNQNTGAIVIGYTYATSGFNNWPINIKSYNKNGGYQFSINNNMPSFPCYRQTIYNLSGDDDSLICYNIEINCGNELRVYNIYTGQIFKYFRIQNNSIIKSFNKKFYIKQGVGVYAGDGPFGKLGDSSYVPFGILDLQNQKQCYKSNFSPSFWVNSGKPPYTFNWSPTYGVNIVNGFHTVINIDTTTTYILTITDANNVTVSDTVTYTIYPKPFDTIIPLSTAFFCYGILDSVRLVSPTSNYSKKWYSIINNSGPYIDTLLGTNVDSIWAKPGFVYFLNTIDSTIHCVTKTILDLNYHPKYAAIIIKPNSSLYNRVEVNCDSFTNKTLIAKNAGFYQSGQIKWYKNGIIVGSSSQITVNSPGQYILKITDSICSLADTIDLVVIPSCNFIDSINVCMHNNYTFADSTVFTNVISDTFHSNHFVSSVGCDSNITTYLKVIPNSIIPTFYDTICASQLPFIWHGLTLASSGVYTKNYVNILGCDSVATLNLVVNPNPPIGLIPDADTTICPGTNYILHAKYTSPQYSWAVNGTTISSADSLNILYKASYRLIVTDTNGCKSKDSVCINIMPNLFPIIIKNNAILTCTNVSNVNFIWRKNGIVIGTNSDTVAIMQNGIYIVKVLDSNLCMAFDTLIINNVALNNLSVKGSELIIYPNPAKSILYVEGQHVVGDKIEIFNTLGQKVIMLNCINENKEAINIAALSNGLYAIKVNNTVQKFRKE